MGGAFKIMTSRQDYWEAVWEVWKVERSGGCSVGEDVIRIVPTVHIGSDGPSRWRAGVNGSQRDPGKIRRGHTGRGDSVLRLTALVKKLCKNASKIRANFYLQFSY